MRRVVRAVSDYLHDLGVGGWLLVLTGVVGVAIVIAVIQGRGGPDEQSCDQAFEPVGTISQLSRSGPLSPVEAARLHNAGTRLDALSQTALSDEKGAIQDAATLAASAEVGQRFDAVQVLDEFYVACPGGGLH
jgi:hypothetical protein